MEFAVIGVIVYILCIIVGTAIGADKGRTVDGFLLSMFLGCIGVFIAATLPKKTDPAVDARLQQQHNLLLQTQQAQFFAMQQMQRQPQYAQVPTPPPQGEQKYKIASDGMELGEMTVATVKLLLKSGKLKGEDCYFDPASNEWKPIGGVAASADRKYRVMSNGATLGELPLGTITRMRQTGKLTEDDCYYDPDAEQWKLLDELVASQQDSTSAQA